MKKDTVLVVEDNPALHETLKENLEEDGYEVIIAPTAEDLFKVLKSRKVDIILLDIILPDANGLTLMDKIRDLTDAPVVVVSGKGTMVDRVVGLEMGADDYVSKPFEIVELSARIKANIRRYQFHAQSAVKQTGQTEQVGQVKFGPWILDRSRFQVFDEQGNSADLTVKEFRLLEALIETPHQVLSRDQLLDRAREYGMEVFDRAIDVQITRIRKKINDDPQSAQIIKTVRGAGYMLVAETEIII